MIFGLGRKGGGSSPASLPEPRIVIDAVVKIFILSPSAADKKWNLYVTSFLLEGKSFIACQVEKDFYSQESAWLPKKMRSRESAREFINQLLENPDRVLELNPAGKYDNNTQYRIVESNGVKETEWDALYTGNRLVGSLASNRFADSIQDLQEIQKFLLTTPLKMGFFGNFKHVLKSLQNHYFECLKSADVSDMYLEVLAGVLGAGLGRVEAFLNGPKAPLQRGGNEIALEGTLGRQQSDMVTQAFHKSLGSDFEPNPSIRTFEYLSKRGLLLYGTLNRQQNKGPYVTFVTELLRVAANSSRGYVHHQLIVSEFLFSHVPGFKTHKSGRRVVFESWDSALDSLSSHPWVTKSENPEISNYLITRSLQRLSNGEKKASPEIALFCLALESANPNVSTKGTELTRGAYEILNKSNSDSRLELIRTKSIQKPSFFITELAPDLQVKLASKLNMEEFTSILKALLEHPGPQARTFRNLWLSLKGTVVEQETLQKTLLIVESTGLFGESGKSSISQNWRQWERQNLFHIPRYWKRIFTSEKDFLMMFLENSKSAEFENWFLFILQQMSGSRQLKAWQLSELVGFNTGQRGLLYYAEIHSNQMVSELADAVAQWAFWNKSNNRKNVWLLNVAQQIDSYGTDFSRLVLTHLTTRKRWNYKNILSYGRSDIDMFPLLTSLGNPHYIAIHMRNHIAERDFLQDWPYDWFEAATHENAWSHFYQNYPETLISKNGLGLAFSQLHRLPFSIRRDIISDDSFKKMFVSELPLGRLANLSKEQSNNVHTILSNTPSWSDRSDLVQAMLTGRDPDLVELAASQIINRNQIEQYWLQMLESNSITAQQRALDFLNNKLEDSEFKHYLLKVLGHWLYRVRRIGVELVQKVEDQITLSEIVNAQKESTHPDIWEFVVNNLELVKADQKWESLIDRMFLGEERLVIGREALKQKLDSINGSITSLVPIQTLERLAFSTNPRDRAWALTAIAKEPAKFPSFLVESSWNTRQTNVE